MGLFDVFTDKLADAAGEKIQDLTVGRLERRAGRAAGDLIERGARRAADSVAQRAAAAGAAASAAAATAELPETPGAPAMPAMPGMPDSPGAPAVPTMPGAPTRLGATASPGAPAMPTISGMPGAFDPAALAAAQAEIHGYEAEQRRIRESGVRATAVITASGPVVGAAAPAPGVEWRHVTAEVLVPGKAPRSATARHLVPQVASAQYASGTGHEVVVDPADPTRWAFAL